MPWQTLRQTALTVAAIASFVAGVASLAAALGGYADDGVTPDSAGEVVASVSPMGFAWRDGIRPGQHILVLAPAADPGGWRLETAVGGRTYVSRAEPIESALRESWPLGLLGLVVGSLAVLFRNAHRQWVAPASSVALLAATSPLFLQGNPQLSTAGLASAFLVPWIWTAWRLSLPPLVRLGLASAAILATVVWTVARLGGSPDFDTIDGLRAPLAMVGTVLVVGQAIVVPILSREPMPLHRPRPIDTAVVALMSGASLVLVYFFAVSPILVGGLVLVILVALPTARRWIGQGIKRGLFADLREEAAIEAAEEERARMARELHDVPLQHLSGIIRRLDLRPDAQAESDELRVVASQLRTVATDLRPPVLDDLGLPAALAFLAEETTGEDATVVADIADATGIDAASRPPAAVELAVFRITQEAVTNAVHHARAHGVRIEGRVDQGRIDVSVIDDGIGLSADVIRKAGRKGRLGVASMRRRAQAIEADLSIDGSQQGTTVRVVWER